MARRIGADRDRPAENTGLGPVRFRGIPIEGTRFTRHKGTGLSGNARTDRKAGTTLPSGKHRTGVSCYQLFAATQLVDIGGDGADLRLAQTVGPRRHHSKAAVGHRLCQRVVVAPIEPDGIG